MVMVRLINDSTIQAAGFAVEKKKMADVKVRIRVRVRAGLGEGKGLGSARRRRFRLPSVLA